MALSHRLVAGLLGVALLSGCATSTPGEGFLYALNQTGERTREAFSDPVRRSHLVSEISLHLGSGAAVAACVLALPGIGLFLCPAAGLAYYFLTYEYVLEPLSKQRVKEGKPSLVGPYFERGPQDGEVFVNP